ncbi:MAG TPA: hypothetical protein VKU82_11880 [Planctomycetaceae bacterium]|nr:hypothetical protein [Planctomycetaceae bacterium]
MGERQPVNPHFETIAIAAVTVCVIAAMFMPGLAIAFILIAGIVRWLNYRHRKSPPEPP